MQPSLRTTTTPVIHAPVKDPPSTVSDRFGDKTKQLSETKMKKKNDHEFKNAIEESDRWNRLDLEERHRKDSIKRGSYGT